MKGKCSILLISRILCIKTDFISMLAVVTTPSVSKHGRKEVYSLTTEYRNCTWPSPERSDWQLGGKPHCVRGPWCRNSFSSTWPSKIINMYEHCMKSLVFINQKHDYNLNAQNSNSVKSFWSIQKNRIIVQHVLSKTFTAEENIKISSNDETHTFFDKCLLT